MFKKALCAILILEMGFLSPVFRAHADASENPFNPILQSHPDALIPGLELFTEARTLLRRQQHPGSIPTWGAANSVPEEFEVEAFELRLQAYRAHAENWLGTHADALPLEAKVELINQYFNLLSTDASLRLARQASVNPAWSERNGLTISQALYAELPNLTRDNASQPISVTRAGDEVHLSLSARYVHQLSLGALSRDPTDENYLTLLQALATKQLQDNLAALHLVRDPALPPVRAEAPPSLRRKLPALEADTFEAVLAEETRSRRDQAYRAATIEAVSSRLADLPLLVTDEFLADLAELTTQDLIDEPGPGDDLATNWGNSLREAQRSRWAELFGLEIQETNEELEAGSAGERAQRLAEILSNAAANAVLQKIFDIAENSEAGWEINEENQMALLRLVENRRRAYQQALGAEPRLGAELLSTIQSKTDHRTVGTTDRQAEFLRTLLTNVEKQSQYLEGVLKGEKLDLYIMTEALAAQIEMPGLPQNWIGRIWYAYVTSDGNDAISPLVQDWIGEIIASPTYAAAKLRFHDLVASLAGPAAILNPKTPQAALDLTYLNRYLSTHDFRPSGNWVFADPAWAESRYLTEELAKAGKKDVADLIKLGKLFKFDQALAATEPSVADVLSESHRKKYFEHAAQSVLNRYPILTVPVNVSGPGEKPKLRPLHVMLKRLLNGAAPDQMRGEARALAQAYLAQAIETTAANVQSDILKIGEAKTIQALEPILTRSTFLQLVLRGYPEFNKAQRRILEDLFHPSVYEQLSHQYLTANLVGLGAMLLIWVGRVALAKRIPALYSVFRVLSVGTAPYQNLLLKSLWFSLVGDLIVAYRHLKKEEEALDLMEELYHSSVAGSPFFNLGTLSSAQDTYASSRRFFYMQAAFGGLMLYIPIFKARAILKTRGFMGDVRAFQTLKIRPGEWLEIRTALERVEAASAAGLVSKAELTAAQAAFRRLAGKLKSGRNWNLRAMREHKPTTPVDRSLVRAIKNARGRPIGPARPVVPPPTNATPPAPIDFVGPLPAAGGTP
ncbi:MAG: hypothetical protein AB7P04_00265 [Bacteriovoracia bacterium]